MHLEDVSNGELKNKNEGNERVKIAILSFIHSVALVERYILLRRP